MLEVSAILTRVVMKGSVPSGMSKSADSVLGFFSIRIAMLWVFARPLSIVIGTTAPFSAMSGAVIWTCALSTDPPPPSAFKVAATVLVSNAALFHCCAKAPPARISPAAAASASTPVPPPAFSIPRLLMSIGTAPYPSASPDSTVHNRGMANFTPASALIGGALIGISATLLLWMNGRIAGVSGIMHGALRERGVWRWLFLAGLAAGVRTALRLLVAAAPARRGTGGLRHGAGRRLHQRARRMRDQPPFRTLARGDADVSAHRDDQRVRGPAPVR